MSKANTALPGKNQQGRKGELREGLVTSQHILKITSITTFKLYMIWEGTQFDPLTTNPLSPPRVLAGPVNKEI